MLTRAGNSDTLYIMALGNSLLLLSLALATGCATASPPRLVQHRLTVHRAAASPGAAVLVPAAQGGTALPWAPTPLPEGSIAVRGPFGDALNLAARLHRRLDALGIRNKVICRQAPNARSPHEIRIVLGSSARLAQLTASR